MKKVIQSLFSQKKVDDQERDLVKDIQGAGYQVKSVWDFVNTSEDYSDAIPVLLSHLNKPYPTVIQEGIIRSLAIKNSNDSEVLKKLISIFREEKDEYIRWVVANTLSVRVSKKEFVPDILALLRDESFGDSRSPLICLLCKFLKKDDAFVELLLNLVRSDLPGIRNQSIVALGRIKCVGARSIIAGFLNHEDSYVRQKAKAALKKIDSA